MRKFVIVAAKLILSAVSLVGIGLLLFAGWLVWHYEYALGLPSEDGLASISTTGPACTAAPDRTYISLADIPPLLRKAAIAYEQPDFYEARSLSPIIGIAHAAANGGKGPPSGIIQSVTRCLMSFSTDCCRGIDMHIATIVLMQRVARTLSRDRILEIYLNESYFGRGNYGVGSASLAYFGRPLGLLAVDEIAFIVALPRMPALLNRRRDIALDRRNLVIARMQHTGIISDAEAMAARERPLAFRDPPPVKTMQQQAL
ncbi:transglycosylase domain-containing protein [Bradyrhizobium sp. 27S5]|uniref:transglycosylase domain-containing protein n=1 Tax=Bradyrhizobium sp. 27S5 TaxID=3139728 RepID=UPI0030CECC66